MKARSCGLAERELRLVFFILIAEVVWKGIERDRAIDLGEVRAVEVVCAGDARLALARFERCGECERQGEGSEEADQDAKHGGSLRRTASVTRLSREAANAVSACSKFSREERARRSR